MTKGAGLAAFLLRQKSYSGQGAGMTGGVWDLYLHDS